MVVVRGVGGVVVRVVVVVMVVAEAIEVAVVVVGAAGVVEVEVVAGGNSCRRSGSAVVVGVVRLRLTPTPSATPATTTCSH